MEESLIEVEVNALRVSPFQPRKEINEEELEELALSIKEVGLIQPPVVRKIMQGDKFLYYELIAGERRWRAAQRAGWTHLVVLVRQTTDIEAAKASLIENIQRVELNPLEMAHAFLKLIDVFQMTQEEVALKVGKKRSTIANYLRLLSLPDTIRHSLVQGSITMGHAKAILSLDSFEMKEKLHHLILSQELTVRETEKESQRLVRKLPVKKESEHHVQDLEERLTTHFGRRVTIADGQGQGTIAFSYYSLDDLDCLLHAFGIDSSI